jgi:GNAT superfamily N-acetyltransferase
MPELAAEAHEELEDGTRSTTPDGDNLVLDFARTEAAAFGALARCGGGRLLDDDEAGLHLRDLALPTPFGNTALLTRPVDPGDSSAVAGRIKGFYDAVAGGPYLVFSPWRTSDWSEHGFHRVGHPPLMFRPQGGSVPVVDGVRIVEVSDQAALDDFERTLVEAYPTPELQPWHRRVFFHTDVLATAWRLYVAYDGERAVATAAAFVGPSITLVECVSTRPECRGRGIGAAVTVAAGLAQPDQASMLISSDLGNGVYRGLGYLPLQRYALWLGVR